VSDITSRSRGAYTFLPQEHVVFGVGSLEGLAGEVERVGGRRALVITGRSLATRTTVIDAVARALGPYHAATFDGIGEHAPRGGVARAVAAARARAADTLVSVGGGSPIDAAKAVALELSGGHGSGGVVLPHIAIPTTLSAAEFSHLVGVTDETGGPGDRPAKAGFADPRVAPRGVILDAALTLPTPERLWLSSGVRALDHAVETLYAPGAHPIEDVLALEAIRRLFRYLPLSKERPDDLDARAELQLAAWMSFFGEVNTPMGLSHNLGRRMGATYGVPHGITSCVTLAPVMRFMATRDAPHAEVIARIGHAIAGDVVGDDLRAAQSAVDAVGDLVVRLGLPTRLREVGIEADAIPAIAAGVAGAGAERARIEELLHTML
jgi:maleylacetate reductase